MLGARMGDPLMWRPTPGKGVRPWVNDSTGLSSALELDVEILAVLVTPGKRS